MKWEPPRGGVVLGDGEARPGQSGAGCDPTTLPPGPPAGRWPLPFSRRRREMSSNKVSPREPCLPIQSSKAFSKHSFTASCSPDYRQICSNPQASASRALGVEQRSAVFVILFALITILILYSSNSANEVFHYGSLRGRTRRPVNLRKWSFSNAYFPILGNKTLPSRCNQCVIITSSSHLLGTKLGPEIERAECTIRMNDAPTTGYSADVGNKTTFRVVAHSSVFRVLRKPQEFVNRTPETVFIFWGPPNKMQKPQGSLLRVIQRAGLAFPNMEAYAVSPARMQQFDDLFRGETGKDREKSHSWLSTGWFTMVIAVELCDHVHVYGMVPPDYCSQRPRLQRMPYHYYEPKGPDECVTYIQNEHSRKGNHHRFITEKRVFSSWAQLYGITFSHPSWT
ncbi:alpha-N-acetylgalactosaminide alpha-2,6-sialyltransferase 6 isoform X2 [Grammomys surdaster]|uniref:alpha-N-acetylgalactosaminide alpha-2,6-sialyltransferase 6 isoform X2 n=2 Tax=Murinae TaxID=39107 RepID=UPI0010A0102C|nr:alpha-N-acetylgalactosaminide alpha-2,6-sialyltransferase 6 isoform X2 [Grammomys surdaster]